MSRNGLRRWLGYTDHAWESCGVTLGRDDPARAVLDFVNSADLGTLDEQVGLRSDTAQAVVNGRPYDSLEQLDAIDGVGPATMRQIEDYALGDPANITPEEARQPSTACASIPTIPTRCSRPSKLGVLTTGVQYGYFRRLFQTAYGDGWLRPTPRFKARVGMPKGSHPSAQPERVRDAARVVRATI